MHFKLVCDGSGSVNSKVLHNSCWNWPSARSEELVEIQSGLLQVSLAQEDLVKWLLSSSRQYTCI